MKKICLLFGCIVACFFLIGVCAVCAEGEESSGVLKKQPSGTDWKQELISDKQQINQQRQQIKQNAQEARTQEQQLKEQIKSAVDSGDTKLARELREQLRATHMANVKQMVQDKDALKTDMKDFRSDVRKARQDGVLPPKRDKDNNPPGPKGGPGTNWENKPGPQGGPGASPDRKPIGRPRAAAPRR
jgi:seryl-tRNA synthetase